MNDSQNIDYKESFLALQKENLEQKNVYQNQIDSQTNTIDSQTKKITTLDHRVIVLEEHIILLKRARFASSSEKVLHDLNGQLGLFNEAESCQTESEQNDVLCNVEPVAEPKQPKRNFLPAYLPREEVVIDFDDTTCAHGHALTPMGEEVSEQLDIVPMQLKVIRTIRKKYVCKTCLDQPKTATLPEKILPRSNAAPGLLAQIAISKYSDGLPLYRQSKIFERCEIDLSRSTMSNWMVKLGQAVQPMINLMREDLQASPYVQCDESPMQVLKEPRKSVQSKSYMWIAAKMHGSPIVLYDYHATRSKEVPGKILQDFKGFLQVDGYAGYNELCAQEHITRLGCWAHARRKFFEASKVTKHPGLSNKALSFVQKLYKIEKKIKDLANQTRHQVRQEQSKKILADFKTWLDQSNVLPSSALGKAIAYTQNQWPSLQTYLEDPMLHIDNNYIENKVRPFAIGRKNWLFANTPNGAHASANLYSLIETAKANNLNPFKYLQHLFTNLPKAHTLSKIEKLLPYNVKL